MQSRQKINLFHHVTWIEFVLIWCKFRKKIPFLKAVQQSIVPILQNAMYKHAKLVPMWSDIAEGQPNHI